MLLIQKKRQSIVFFLLTFALFPNISEASGRCVVLVHGLTRSHYSMAKLAKYLESHDYTVVNKDYASTQKSVEEIAHVEIPPMVDACLKYHPDNIYFVTHSIGGIVLRQYLQTHNVPQITRIVMLGPPNHGSPLADLFHDNVLFKVLTGPAGQELTTDNTALPNNLDRDSPYQIGVIAGNFSFFPFSKLFFHEDNDGKVAISSTQLTGMKDFIILPVSHTFIMRNPVVEEQVLYFFDYGRFIH